MIKLNRDRKLVLVADTTFFTRENGITVFREPNLQKNIWWQKTNTEKAVIYEKGKRHLENNGFEIVGVVLDGRTGIRGVFKGVPVQMCHFHQQQIITKYLTKKPKLLAGQELRNLVLTKLSTNENVMADALLNWQQKYEQFLKQKTTDTKTGRWFYTHKNIRSAYRSLKTNLPYLYTYQKYPNLKIPNTTNSLDGYFSRLKSLLTVHHGLNQKRRNRIMVEILTGKR